MYMYSCLTLLTFHPCAGDTSTAELSRKKLFKNLCITKIMKKDWAGALPFRGRGLQLMNRLAAPERRQT